ncbi:MAG TPA: hypothetical protein VK738_16435 [Terriglobales bacterium]|jgi:hypothetical protein|nr:hypothetical protein [Terriglobales bacterium]
MQRLTSGILSILLLIGSVCCGQSLGDAARKVRKQQGKNGSSPTKVFTSDDVSVNPDTTVRLVPGESFSGQGTLIAPGDGKHKYRLIRLDASRFVNGGTLHISITVGSGNSDASFDLYPQGTPLPVDGFPKSLAHAWGVPRMSSAKIDYRFDQATVFLLGAEGDWPSKAGATNTYSFLVSVESK